MTDELGPKPLHYRLTVIPEPEPNTRRILALSRQYHAGQTVISRGTDVNLSLDCGTCGSPLVVGYKPGKLEDVVVECNKCGSYNDNS